MKKLLLLFTLCFIVNADQSVDLAMQKLQKANVQFLECMFSDLLGAKKSILVPIEFAQQALEKGLHFDGSSIKGCSNINDSDLLLKPHLSTLHASPWHSKTEHKVACVIADIYRDDETPYEGDPRNILKSVINEAHELGYNFFVGPELEFFVFKNGKPCDQLSYFDIESNIDAQSIVKRGISALYTQNILVEKFHHEVASGQYEISIKYGDALSIADQIIKAKQTIKTVAEFYNLESTFMPKPIFGANGSAMHIHFSLWDTNNNCNAFYDAENPHRLSKTAQHFLAGVLKHIKELNILFNPTVNSYKRLVPGYEAPTFICWGTKNRSAMIRIPQVNKDEPNAVRAEIRSPDPSCNPYLAFAALLKAGLEGIKKEYELPVAMKNNVYHMQKAELKDAQIQSLPASLAQAVQLFETSSFAQELLGKTLFNELVSIKKKEVDSFSTTVTDWELQKYF